MIGIADDIRTSSVTRSHEYDSSCCREMKLVRKKEDIGEGKLDDYHSGEKEELCFTNSSEGFYVSSAVAGQDKIVRGHKSASYVRKELRAYAAEVGPECSNNLGPHKCHSEHDHSEHGDGRENHQKYDLKKIPASENVKLKENLNPELSCESARHRCTGRASIDAKQNGTPITIHLSNYTLSSQQCSSDIAPLRLQNKNKLVNPVALQSHDAGRNENHEANYHSVRTEKGKEHKLNDHCQEKGKEKVLQSSENCCSTSKNREDNSESVESSNSQKLFLRGKRPWSFDPNYLGCKKLKKECDGSSSGSQIRKDSSFINWMSSMTNNLSRFDHTKPSTSLFPQSSNMNEKFDSVPVTVNTGGAFFKSGGFTSLFQGLTRPNVILHNRGRDHDHQRVDSGSYELKVDNPIVSSKEKLNNLNMCTGRVEESSNGAIRIGGFTECGKLQSEELNQDNYQVQEHPLASLDTSPNPSTVYREMGHKMWQIGVRKIIEPPSCSTRNHYVCAEENVNKITCVPNKYTNVELNGRCNLFENLWVARFLRKKSSSDLNLGGCRFDVNLETVSPNNENCLPDNSWRVRGIYDKYQQNAEHYHDCHLESRRNILSGHLKQFQNSHRNSCSLSRAEDNIRSNISPIMPSQMFKKTEPLASLFAKRLDALRHVLSSKISDSLSHAATTCLFCGKSGHNIRNCLALAESGKSLLPIVESFDGNDITSSFCIRCFQFNHWAIACPGAASKVNNSYDLFMPGNMRIGSNEEKIHVDKSCHHDERVLLWTNRRRNSKDKAVCTTNRSSSAGKLAPSSTEDKNKVSYLRDNESKINPCKSMTLEVISGQNEIFEAIKKLQLSRTAITRWLKSPKACPHLEGFFLRLRLGKWEKGRGGTGYHVTRIKGVSCEDNISVGIGDLTCSVDCRFVSNHDYTEDELKTWCSATLKLDGKLPSKEELDMKFKERKELGF